MSKRAKKIDLTSTEQHVLRMIVGGMSDNEIRFALDLSETNIKTIVTGLYGKIGVSDREAAATFAIKGGLVEIDL